MVQETGKYTVITGASSGIGYETAKAFAGRGKNLVITARRRDNLEMLKREILEEHPDLDIIIRSTDLSIPENVHRLYEGLKDYEIETWVNNAGFGNYGSVADQDLQKIGAMLRLNIEALTILSSLYVRDYRDVEGAQLINVSSCGGYTIVPAAVTYCAAKFYVSTFTEGLAWELKETGAKMRAKVLAPAATKTEFGMVANNVNEYDYDKSFVTYHTSRQMAGFLLELYDNEKVVGLADRESFCFRLADPLFPYAGNSSHNQQCR